MKTINDDFVVHYRLSTAQCDTIIIKDLKDNRLSSNPEKYREANSFAYYVMLNSWLCITRNKASVLGEAVLHDALLAHGALKCIKTLSTDADSIMHESDDISDLGKAILQYMDYNIADALQVLRFCKRFSPLEADLVKEDTSNAFVSLLNEVKMRQRKEYPYWLIQKLQDVVYDITKGYAFDPTKGYFSSGAVIDCDNCKALKFNDWLLPYFLDRMYPISETVEPDFSQLPGFRLKGSHIFIQEQGIKTAEAVVVPKSYKIGRLIAKEHSFRQWMLQAIRESLTQCIATNGYDKYLTLDEQYHNQYLCYDTDYTTVDLSSASDRVSATLARSIFPNNVMEDIDNYRSDNVLVGKRLYSTQMIGTSGSAMTFVVESIVFLSCALVATDLVELYTGETLKTPRVYGDDILIDNKAYETLSDIMLMLGFVINADKSFSGTQLYRESCGFEQYNGVETTTSYWPRKPIKNDVSSYDSLVSLHNANVNIPELHIFLKSVVRTLAGKWFTTTPLAESLDEPPTDVIDPVKEVKMRRAPYDIPDRDSQLYEMHGIVRMKGKGKGVHMSDMYYYVMYLLHGPQYDTPLDRLLGVSTSRIDPNDGYSRMEPVFGFKSKI